LAEKKHRVLRDSFRKESERLKFAERTLEFLHPERVLKRGYSITWLDGKVVKSGSQVERGNEIRTKLASGEITSKVLKIKDK